MHNLDKLKKNCYIIMFIHLHSDLLVHRPSFSLSIVLKKVEKKGSTESTCLLFHGVSSSDSCLPLPTFNLSLTCWGFTASISLHHVWQRHTTLALSIPGSQTVQESHTFSALCHRDQWMPWGPVNSGCWWRSRLPPRLPSGCSCLQYLSTSRAHL